MPATQLVRVAAQHDREAPVYDAGYMVMRV